MSNQKRNTTSARRKLVVFYLAVALLSWLSIRWLERPRFRNALDTPRVVASRHYDEPLQNEIVAIWQRIERQLEKHDPKFVKWLKPPVSDAEIAATEAELGYPLPGDVKASLKVHNGAVRLASNHGIHNAGGIESLRDMYIESCNAYPIGVVHPDPEQFHAFWHPGWLPVGGWQVYELVVNTETGGVYYWNEYSARFQAKSWKRWLENVAQRLESGEFKPVATKYGYDWTNEDKYDSPGAEEQNGWE